MNSCKSLLFHGGDTGSIPVRDAKLESPLEIALCRFAFNPSTRECSVASSLRISL